MALIDEELIKYLEDLSFLSLSDEERGRISGDLEKIIAGMELLSALDTGELPDSDFAGHNRGFALNNLRKDEVKASLSREEILKNAPEARGGAFAVPRAVE